ncbi:MAG TPA: hypothetical protein VFV29_02495 [Actinomycetota bacterium]|nr:hypothetical protein [Actinomycetota bacterium]
MESTREAELLARQAVAPGDATEERFARKGNRVPAERARARLAELQDPAAR